MRIDVLTLFPGIFAGFLGESIVKLAIERQLLDIRLRDIRDWAEGKHKSVDDRPFGGGPGMVLMPGPVVSAVEAVQAEAVAGELILLTPAGERFTQRTAEELAAKPRLVMVCGRYEGFDERIRQVLRPREISLGDFVCNGGEVPAMAIIESVMRLLPGVLGDAASVVEESHAELGRLEYPQYTRPREYRGLSVPDILLTGNHPAIAAWRRRQSDERYR